MYRLIPTIPYLTRLAFKKAYEIGGCSDEEERILEEGIKQQTRKATLDDKDRKQLKFIINMLINAEKRKFDHRKELFEEHDIDYKKVFKKDIAGE